MNHKPKTPKQWLRSGVQPQTQTLRNYAQFAAQLKQWQQLFRQVVPETLAAHCQVLNVRDNKLVVETDAATWATQLKFLQSDIITHFQQDAMPQLRQLDVRVKPASQQQATVASSLTRKERLLRLAETSDEPLKSELLKMAEKMW